MADMMTNFTISDMIGTKEHAARKAAQTKGKKKNQTVPVEAPVEAPKAASETTKPAPAAKTSGKKK